jgi:PAS domain S-box-containing protein
VNNPLPVDRFSIADAARRTWPALIESMLEAVCLVEPEGLRIVAANVPAGRLFGVAPAELVGRDMRATSATPEDEAFWREVGSGREPPGIVSAAYVLAADGIAVPVVRRVSRVEPAPGTALYVVALHDRRDELRSARSGDIALAQLAATLESVREGILVVDLAGRIGHFNRRFAGLWNVPEEMLRLRADDTILDWMRAQVEDPAAYMRGLAAIDADPLLETTQVLRLRSGARLERSTLPQRSQGRPIGRVFSFRPAVATPG